MVKVFVWASFQMVSLSAASAAEHKFGDATDFCGFVRQLRRFMSCCNGPPPAPLLPPPSPLLPPPSPSPSPSPPTAELISLLANDLVVSSASENSLVPELNAAEIVFEKIVIPFNRMRVLIAEDKDIAALVMGRFCQRLGISYENIKRVANGRDAIETFATHKPHLVFMDRNMPSKKDAKVPVKDGIEATIGIRAIQFEVGITPVIICISDDDNHTSQRLYLSSGMDDFFFKSQHNKIDSLSAIFEKYFINNENA